MAISDIFSILGLGGNNPSAPSSDAGGAAMAATNPLAAIAGPILGGGDPNAIDPQSGMRVGDVRGAQMQALGEAGALLMAASRKGQSHAQRAAEIAAIAPMVAQIPKNILNAAQSRLVQQQISNTQLAQSRQEEAIKSALADPNVHPAIKQLIQANPDTGLKVLAEQALPTDIERNAQAVGVPTKEYFNRLHPEPNQWTYTSDGRGGYLGYNRVTNETKFVKPNGSINALSGQPESGQAPSQQAASAAPPKVPSNAGDAFGLSMTPVWTGIAGLTGQPTSPDVQKKVTAGAEMQSLNDELTGLLAADLPGMKSKYTAERITRELPTVHGWFTGPDTAAATYEGKLPQLKDKMQEALQSYNSAVSLGQEGEAAKAANHYRALEAAIAKTSETIKALRANQAGQPYDPSLATGRGLANSNTNQNPQQNNATSTIDKARQLLGR